MASSEDSADYINAGVAPWLVVGSGADVTSAIWWRVDFRHCCVAKILTGVAPSSFRVIAEDVVVGTVVVRIVGT